MRNTMDPMFQDPLLNERHLSDSPTLLIPPNYGRGLFKTEATRAEFQRRLKELDAGLGRDLDRIVNELQVDEAKFLMSERAERTYAQFSAYITQGFTEEQAWELIKLEAQKNENL